MKENDLMIGNWIRVNGKNRQISQITNKKVGFIIPEDNFKMKFSRISLIHPIEITRKLLLKLGFSERKEGLFLEYYRYRSTTPFLEMVAIYDYLKSEVRIVNVDSSDFQLKPYKLKYVHELQNVLNLCKINKEIKL